MEFSLNFKPTFQAVSKAFMDIAAGFRLQEELEKFAYSVEREAKKVTPVDTGRLRASISTDVGPLMARIAPHTNYALFVHEGHRSRGGSSFVRPRPFLTTGFEVARLRSWGHELPFVPHIKKVIDENLKKL